MGNNTNPEPTAGPVADAVTGETHDTARLGRMIREAREARGIDLQTMAALLKLDKTRLRYIEEGRFQAFPQSVFVRGYLRNCARHLELDEAFLLAEYARLFPDSERSGERRLMRVPPPPLQRGNRAVMLSLGAFAIIVASSWYLVGKGTTTGVVMPGAGPSSSLPDEPGAVGDAVPIGDVARLLPSLLPPIVLNSPAEVGPGPSDGSASAPETGQGANTDIELSVSSLADGTEVGAPLEVLRVAVPGIGGELILEFSGECWVEVRNGEERLLHADLQRAGDRLAWQDLPPYELLLGDARRVNVTYNGDPVPVSAVQGTNTARVTVGEP